MGSWGEEARDGVCTCVCVCNRSIIERRGEVLRGETQWQWNDTVKEWHCVVVLGGEEFSISPTAFVFCLGKQQS